MRDCNFKTSTLSPEKLLRASLTTTLRAGPPLSFSLPRREKEALPESRQFFEAAAARTCGLVNLVFSLQTVFSSASIRLVIKSMVIIEPAVPWQIKMATRSARRARSQTPLILDEILIFKFERRLEIYLSVLNIANEVSNFP